MDSPVSSLQQIKISNPRSWNEVPIVLFFTTKGPFKYVIKKKCRFTRSAQECEIANIACHIDMLEFVPPVYGTDDRERYYHKMNLSNSKYQSLTGQVFIMKQLNIAK